jgi:RNA polymerase sigma-70 factor (ECF subfamily)
VVASRPGDDSALVDRAREGDVDAYAALLAAHRDAARRLAAVVGGAGDADEVAQDAFVKAWYALPSFRHGAAFRPWLLRIVVNEARNRRRAAGRRAGHELRFAADRAMAAGETAPSPEAAVLVAESRRSVLAALDALPDRQRDVVACRHLLGLSEQETAAVLGLAPGTVKSRTSRALRRMQRTLAAGRDEELDDA